MKTLLTLISVFIVVLGCCQHENAETLPDKKVISESSEDSLHGNCDCKEIAQEMGGFACDTTHLSDGSMLYSLVNCDSSWIIFENKNGLRKIIYTLDKESLGLTGRIGYQCYAPDDYGNVLLIENILVTGSEETSGYVLLDKTTGEIIKDFGMVIFEGTDYTDNNKLKGFVAYFKDKTYNSVIFYNISNGHTEEVQLKKGAVKKAFSKNVFNVYHPSSQTTFKNELVTISFHDDEGKDIGQKIVFNYAEFQQGRSGKTNKDQ